MTTPPSYKKINPADSPILMLVGAVRHPAAHHRQRLRRQFHRPADLAGARCRPGQHRRRAASRDPDPGRSGQARFRRADVGRGAQHARQFDDDRGEGHRQHRERRPSPSRPTIRSSMPEPFNDAIVAYRNGGPIRVRDVGQAIAAAPTAQSRPTRTASTAFCSSSTSSPAPTSSRPSTRSRKRCRG